MYLARSFHLEIKKMEVKIEFLHGDPKEYIYMKKPKGFTMKQKKDLVCRINKSFYGLK